jgi:hypothetical protein
MNKNESVLTSVCSKLRFGPIFLVTIVSIGVISFLIVVQARANQGVSAQALKAVSGVNQEMATMYKTVQDQAKGAGMKLPDAPNFDPTAANKR